MLPLSLPRDTSLLKGERRFVRVPDEPEDPDSELFWRDRKAIQIGSKKDKADYTVDFKTVSRIVIIYFAYFVSVLSHS